jgi:two-component system chemotaxis response regulator CheY
MDGIELCRTLRREDRGYTYFIVVTGLADREHALRALREGADEYLTKPIDFEQLEARLVSAVRVTANHKALEQRNARLRRDSERAFSLARVDALTSLGNRLRLAEDLGALRSRASRYGHTYCVAMCDVDRFKDYNDLFGHLSGDEVLRRVAGAIQGGIRSGDTAYRYGGEEFLVILPEQTPSDARLAMERVRHRVQALRVPHPANTGGVITVSIGVAELVQGSQDAQEQSLERADAALYCAKTHGRNRVEIDELRALRMRRP